MTSERPQGEQREQGRPSTDDQGSVTLNELADQLGAVARQLEGEDDLDAMLDEIVASAVRLVPGAQGGSLSMVVNRRTVTSQHPSGRLSTLVDEVQTDTGEGPCLSAVYEQQTVRVSDMAEERRWPRFARRAAEAGAGSMLSFQLFVAGDNLGALNLVSGEPGAFDDESEQVGLLFASHAAVAFASARKIDDLSRAVDTRDVIGQAKGVLMERYQISAVQAFRVLTRVSQGNHRKLRDVAHELATTGHLADLTRQDTKDDRK